MQVSQEVGVHDRPTVADGFRLGRRKWGWAARHSLATLALDGGATHIRFQRLGHAEASVTVNVYDHVLPSAD